MADGTIAKLMVRIGGDISELESSFSKAQRKLASVGESMQRVGSRMTMAISAPMAAVGGLAIKTAGDFESLQQSMNILNGSIAEGTRNFERLKEFSAGTPFQLKGLAEAQNMLQGFGLSADQAFESMSMIGDIAAVTGGDIKGIGIAFGQAAAEGRLMTRDIRQLINQGVPAIKLLADTMNVAQSEVLELASEGEISFEILQKAFDEATSAGGMFADGMAKQAKTINGIMSTLKDNISIAMADIGKSIVETFDLRGAAERLIAGIQSALEAFNSLSKQTKQMAFVIAGAFGAAGPIIAALGTLSLAISAISAPLVGVVAAVGLATAAIVKNWGEVEAYFTTGAGAEMWDSIQQIVKSTTEAITRIWGVFGDSIMQMTESTFTVVSETLRAAFNGISIMIDTFTGRWITDWDGYLRDTTDSLDAVYGKDGSARIVLEEFLIWARTNWLTRAGYTIGAGLGNAIISALNESGIIDSKIPLIEDLDSLIAEKISLSRSERALRVARENMMEALVPDDGAITIPDIDIPDIDKGGSMIFDLQGLERAGQGLKRLGSKVNDVSNTTQNQFANMKAATGDYGSFHSAVLDNMSSKWDRFVGSAKKAGFDVIGFLSNQMASAFTSFGKTIGETFAGVDDKFKTGLDKVLLLVADFAVQLGQMLIGIGTAMALIPFMQGPAGAYIAGGTALVALGSGAKALINKKIEQRRNNTPAMANGGLAFGPTLAVVGDNRNARSDPEVIAPLSKLQGMMGSNKVRVEGQIRGDVIHLSNIRGGSKFR